MIKMAKAKARSKLLRDPDYDLKLVGRGRYAIFKKQCTTEFRRLYKEVRNNWNDMTMAQIRLTKKRMEILQLLTLLYGSDNKYKPNSRRQTRIKKLFARFGLKYQYPKRPRGLAKIK